MLNIDELRKRAKRRVPRMAFDYLDGGAEDESGMAHNRQALQRYRFIPRYLVDVSGLTTDRELFGHTYSAPFGIAPTGLANMIWPGAELMLLGEAQRRNLPFVLSTPSTTAIEAAAESAPGASLWFQLYVSRQPDITDDLMKRASDAGVHVLVITVDVPVAAKRERDLRNGMKLPLRLSLSNFIDFALHPRWSWEMLRHGAPGFANLAPYAGVDKSTKTLAEFMASTLTTPFTWPDLERIREQWRGALVVKGILDPRDAKRCAEIGCDGIQLSNHGGRQLDSAVSPLEVLPAVRQAVGGDVKLLIDSGVRRGSDIAKLLALGADFAFFGRPGLYGAGAAGTEGVRMALDCIADEFNRTLAQLGCCHPNELRADMLTRTLA
jgi:(S)-mandelate dehydrogenase